MSGDQIEDDRCDPRLETMMIERGVAVDHSTIYRWVQNFAARLFNNVTMLFALQDGIVGEARLVERTFGLGPCALTEVMVLLQDRLASAET